MKTLLPLRLAAATLLLPTLLLVSACSERVTAVQTFPPNVDLKAVTQPKPKPTPDIITDPQANERYNAAVEGWGDGVLDAGQRICEWANDMGAKVPFLCRRDEN